MTKQSEVPLIDIHSIRQQLKTKIIYDIPMRVTFYARVSSESDEQLNSLSNQISYYDELIRRNAQWTFVPGYIDEGLSGISTKKRENFHQMVNDGKDDKFDLIITKKMKPARSAKYIRADRTAMGHNATVRYLAGLCVSPK